MTRSLCSKRTSRSAPQVSMDRSPEGRHPCQPVCLIVVHGLLPLVYQILLSAHASFRARAERA